MSEVDAWIKAVHFVLVCLAVDSSYRAFNALCIKIIFSASLIEAQTSRVKRLVLKAYRLALLQHYCGSSTLQLSVSYVAILYYKVNAAFI